MAREIELTPPPKVYSMIVPLFFLLGVPLYTDNYAPDAAIFFFSKTPLFFDLTFLKEFHGNGVPVFVSFFMHVPHSICFFRIFFGLGFVFIFQELLLSHPTRLFSQCLVFIPSHPSCVFYTPPLLMSDNNRGLASWSLRLFIFVFFFYTFPSVRSTDWKTVRQCYLFFLYCYEI